MRARWIASWLGAAFVACAATSMAEEVKPSSPRQVVVVDFAALPSGSLPPLPGEDATPPSDAKGTVTALKVEPVSQSATPRRTHKHVLKKKVKKSERVVAIRPTGVVLGNLYVPSNHQPELDADSSQQLPCDESGATTPLRWETLALGADGNARLEVHEVWFDAKNCALIPGTTSVSVLKALAWDQGKPLVFGMRGDTSVTFVMPRTSDVSAESMVGEPVSVRGAFTRVTFPLGRWGAGSLVANVASRRFETPAGAAPPSEEQPLELGIELVQTMAEKAPTLLVRTRELDPPSPIE